LEQSQLEQRPKLTPKRWEFVRQYIALNNGAAAARKAGYAVASANKEAARLLAFEDVQAALEWYRASEADRLGVTPARVLGELASIAFADFGDYVRLVDGVPIFDMSELPAGATRAIASIDETSSGVRFKLHDKQAALVTLARSFGLLGNDSPAVSVVVGAAESVELATLSADELRAGILALTDGVSESLTVPEGADVVDLGADVVDSGDSGRVSPTDPKNTANERSAAE
jgi:hypothetical protein